MNIQELVPEIVEQIRRVDGVNAVVLGGSRARGRHTAGSDIDLGIYYHPGKPLDLHTLDAVATQLDDDHRLQLLTAFGGWGPWINGGGWLKVHGTSVDFLYRDLARVAEVIEACIAGKVEIFYQPGHPHGFVSSIYMAELALCRPLWEADGRLAALKALTQPYPPGLKRGTLQRFSWEVNFSLQIARKSIPRGDVTYASGCCFRAAACMLQVLFALNGEYWMNEKGALALADTFPLRPPDFKARLERAFGALAAEGAALEAAIHSLEGLAGEVEALTASGAG